MRGAMICAVLTLFGSIALPGHNALGAEPKRLLVIGQGPDGHPPTTHEFMAGTRIIAALLKSTPGVEVTTVDGSEPFKEGPELIAKADGIVLYVCEGASWAHKDPRRWEAITRLAARGGGVAALHWGIGTKDPRPIESWLKVLGGCHGGPDRKYKVLETDFKPAEPRHAIARGIEPMRLKDEFYYSLKFVKSETKIEPVMEAEIEGVNYPVAWAWGRPDGGRSFGFSGLHFHENWKQAGYRRLVAQGLLWTLGQEIPKDGVAVDVPEDVYRLK